MGMSSAAADAPTLVYADQGSPGLIPRRSGAGKQRDRPSKTGGDHLPNAWAARWGAIANVQSSRLSLVRHVRDVTILKVFASAYGDFARSCRDDERSEMTSACAYASD